MHRQLLPVRWGKVDSNRPSRRLTREMPSMGAPRFAFLAVAQSRAQRVVQSAQSKRALKWRRKGASSTILIPRMRSR